MDKEFNKHHLIPSSKWWLTSNENLKRVETKEHSRRHSFFGNETPVEAICHVLLWNDKVRTDNFKQDLMNILDIYLNNYYQKHTHNWFIKSEVETVLNLEDNLL